MDVKAKSTLMFLLQYGQLPVGLVAQLVEHCTGIAEVRGSNAIQAGFLFTTAYVLRTNCKDLSSI